MLEALAISKDIANLSNGIGYHNSKIQSARMRILNLQGELDNRIVRIARNLTKNLGVTVNWGDITEDLKLLGIDQFGTNLPHGSPSSSRVMEPPEPAPSRASTPEFGTSPDLRCSETMESCRTPETVRISRSPGSTDLQALGKAEKPTKNSRKHT